MSEASRPRTPPPTATSSGAPPRGEITPEQKRQIEINRLKAKTIRDQREAEARRAGADPHGGVHRTPSGFVVGQKRPHAEISTRATERAVRDARNTPSGAAAAGAPGSSRPRGDADIQPARKFTKYIEYDFSKMTDTKGGFMTHEDDPTNKTLYAPGSVDEEKPAHMTLKEWERHQLLKKLREQKAGPFEPGLSALDRERKGQKVCRECGSMEIDWKWDEVFGCAVCSACKEKYPEKYSLLTKTEAKEDYLLTDPELRDPELLPHLERPNPHKATWNNMMLYLRYQVEEYAFSPQKWGSAEALDVEYNRRETDKKKRKEDKFRTKLLELKKRTRVEAYKRSRKAGANGGATAGFGDDLGGGKHEHEWGQAVQDPEKGTSIKTCMGCGMEVEELEF